MGNGTEKLKTIASLIGGTLCLLLGTFFIWAYIHEAVIVPWGQPDQSLLYWYAIFPMIGIPVGILGLGLIYRGVKKKK